MSDWIEEKAAKIKREKQKSASDRDWERHAREVILSKRQSVLHELGKVMQRDVDKWNSCFPDDESRVIGSVKISEGAGITIEKSTPPAAVANIQLDPTALALAVIYTHAPQMGDVGVPDRRKIHIDLAKDETIYLTGHTSGARLSYDEISRKIIEAMTDGGTPSI